jgi:hypothetical protein
VVFDLSLETHLVPCLVVESPFSFWLKILV